MTDIPNMDSSLISFIEELEKILDREIGFYAKSASSNCDFEKNEGYDKMDNGGWIRSRYGDGWNDAVYELHFKIYSLIDRYEKNKKIHD